MLDKVLPFFDKINHAIGQGNVYLLKGMIAGDNSRALELYDKALDFFTKYGDIVSESKLLYMVKQRF